MARSGFTLTPAIAGRPAVEYLTGVSTVTSPADADLGVVAEHEAVRGRLHRQAVDLHVLPDQAVFDARGEIADAAALEHDTVLDLGLADFRIVHDRRKRPDVRVHDSGARPDDDRTAHHRVFDDRTRFDDHLPLDPRLRVDGTVDPPLDPIEDQPVRFEHVFELARVFPPPIDDVGPDLQAA